MPTEETLITVLLIALAANLGLMVLVILAAWIRGRRRRIDDAAPIMAPSPGLDAARDAARAAAAAIHPPLGVPGTRMEARPQAPTWAATDAPASVESRSPAGPGARGNDHDHERVEFQDGRFVDEPAEAAGEPADPRAMHDDADMRGDSDDRPAASEPSAGGSSDAWSAAGAGATRLIDPRSGLDSPRAWSRSLSDEMARIARYRRPASIVLVEVEGLERLVDRFGPDAADRLLPVISDTIRKNSRAADHVAALERGRYGILLTETDEIRAINFIERVRTACDAWLAAGAVTLRLAIGWADANAGRTLEDAIATAEERLHADRRRPFPEPDFRTSSLEG